MRTTSRARRPEALRASSSSSRARVVRPRQPTARLGPQRLERRVFEGVIPRRVALVQHAAVRAREQLEGRIGQRGLGLPPVDPDHGQAAARAQNARELGDRLAGVEPVERLADERRVDARVLERDRLGAARDRRAVHRAHAFVRLDRDEAREPPRELPRQASRSRRQVEQRARLRRARAPPARGRARLASTLAGRGRTSRRRRRSSVRGPGRPRELGTHRKDVVARRE